MNMPLYLKVVSKNLKQYIRVFISIIVYKYFSATSPVSTSATFQSPKKNFLGSMGHHEEKKGRG